MLQTDYVIDSPLNHQDPFIQRHGSQLTANELPLLDSLLRHAEGYVWPILSRDQHGGGEREWLCAEKHHSVEIQTHDLKSRALLSLTTQESITFSHNEMMGKQ